MAIVRGEQVSYQYPQNGAQQPLALHHVNLEIKPGQFTVVLGATGSGKSTLMQHFNGLYQPTEGRLQVLDVVFEAGKRIKGLKPLRSRVGLVFQFPEHQLFEETLEKDMMFGPLQFGMSKSEAKAAVQEAMEAVGLPDHLLARSPFELSGGQMRKAAIATVLASRPEMLVLDEPTATLDPVSRRELIALLKHLCTKQGKTVVMVTHRLDEVLEQADQFIIMKQGTITFEGSRYELMDHAPLLHESGIVIPSAMKLALRIQKETGQPLTQLPGSVKEWADWLISQRGNNIHLDQAAKGES